MNKITKLNKIFFEKDIKNFADILKLMKQDKKIQDDLLNCLSEIKRNFMNKKDIPLWSFDFIKIFWNFKTYEAPIGKMKVLKNPNYLNKYLTYKTNFDFWKKGSKIKKDIWLVELV